MLAAITLVEKDLDTSSSKILTHSDSPFRLIPGSSAYLVILVEDGDSGNNEVSSGGLSGTCLWDSTPWFQMPEKLFWMKCGQSGKRGW